MYSFPDANSPLLNQRSRAKDCLEHVIAKRDFEPEVAVEVLRELFDEIEPADRTKIAKRINTDKQPTAEDFRSVVFGAEENPEYADALFEVILLMTEEKKTPELRREVFGHLNYALDELMEDIRNNTPHLATHPDGSLIIESDDPAP